MTDLREPRFLDLLSGIVRITRRVPGSVEESSRGRRTRRGEFGSFSGHRNYERGDEIRHVDWNVYARTGELFLKVFHAEEHRKLTLAVDLSASMSFGTPDRADGTRRLAAVLAALALVRLDGLRLLVYPDSGEVLARAFSGPRDLPRVLDVLGSFAASGKADHARLAKLAGARRAGRLVVWISDFLPSEEFIEPLARLGSGRTSVHGLLPEVAEELRVADSGWLRVSDPETGSEDSFRVDSALRAALEEELREHRLRLARLFARTGHRLTVHPLPPPDSLDPTRWLPRL